MRTRPGQSRPEQTREDQRKSAGNGLPRDWYCCMPELPDLEYIIPQLRARLESQTLESVEMIQPLVLRNLLGSPVEECLPSMVVSVDRKGPFLQWKLQHGQEELHIVIHPMLTGRFSFDQKKKASTCIRFQFPDFFLDYLDDNRMGKVYFSNPLQLVQIPGFANQGMDVLSREFSLEYFLRTAERSRKQSRVFLMDQTRISAIGNAYADEILFEAGIHPKRKMNQLSGEEKEALYEAIRRVLLDSMQIIQKAKPDLDEKYREHMRVRNRKGMPCPACGTKIRRANVLGYDSFFCPRCQPDMGNSFINWSSTDSGTS